MAATVEVLVNVNDSALNDLERRINGLDGSTINLGKSSASAASGINKVSQAASSANTSVGALTKTTVTYDSATNSAIKIANEYSSGLGQTTKTVQTLNKETGRLQQTQKTVTDNYAKAAKEQAKASAKAESDRIKNAKAQLEADKWLDNYFKQQQKIADSQPPTALQQQINDITGVNREAAMSAKDAAKAFEEEFAKADKAAKVRKPNTLLSNIGKFTEWYLIGGAISGITSSIKDAFGTMKAVDSELATVRKVTGESAEAMNELGDAAYKTASKYGVSAEAFLQASGDFAKAGYDNYAELAELATKTQLVGDVTAEQASKFLLAADAAFGYQGNVKELGIVLDEANVIENNFATSIQKITDGLPIVASTASLANMSVEELMASLGTITAVTQESGTKAATAMRALILNILGEVGEVVDEDLTVTQEGVDSMTAALKKYAPEVIEAAKATGEVINPMKAISALSQAYNEGLLTEIELTDILTKVGGKLRTNQLASLVKNFDMYQEMLDMVKNAEGSADAEIDVMLDTWEARSNQLKNSWTQLWGDITDTSFIKDSLGVLTEVINEIDRAIDPDSFSEMSSRIDELNAKKEDGIKLTAAEKLEYDNLTNRVKRLKKSYDEYTESLKESKQVFDADSLTMRTGTEDVLRWEDYSDALDDAYDAFSRLTLGTGDADKALGNYRETLGEVVESYADAANQLQAYADAGYELSESDQQFLDTYNATKDALTNWDETAANAVQAFNESMEGLGLAEGLDVEVRFNPESGEYEAVKASIPSSINVQVKFTGVKSGFWPKGYASGTKNAPEGWALVNEVGAELISDNGRAYIANGGMPALVHLSKGAIVLTAEETKSALGANAIANRNNVDMPAFVGGTGTKVIQSGGSKTATTSRETYGTPKIVSSPPTGSTVTYKSPNGTVYYSDGKNNYKVMGSNPSSYSGGYGGGGSSAPAKPSYNYDDLEKALKDELSDLNELAKWYDNKGEHTTEADTYQQAIDKIAELRDKYLEGGYEETAPEVVKLANDIYDYEEKKSKAEKHAYEDLEDTLDATLDTLDEQIELAENMGDINRAIDLQIQAQEAIAKAIDDAKALGYADDSQEILSLMNKGYGYASDANKSKETLWGNLVDAIQAIKDTVDDANDLAERQTAVEEARLAYEKAQSQRNVRIFNSATGQWEWIANQGQVSSAQKSYEDAQKSLKDAQVSQALSALKSGGNLSDILLSEGLSTLLAQGDASQTAAVATALGLLTGGVDKSASAETKGLFNTDSHDTVTQYAFNGVSISEAVAKSMTLADLAAQLSILNLTTQMPS